MDSTNNLRLRAYTPRDYEMVKGWWVERGWTPPHEFMLPPIGLIVDECAVGWLYQTDAPIAWVEWVVSKPRGGSAREVVAALERLVRELVAIGLATNACVFGCTSKKGLAKMFEKCGAIKSDEGVMHFMWTIQ